MKDKERLSEKNVETKMRLLQVIQATFATTMKLSARNDKEKNGRTKMRPQHLTQSLMLLKLETKKLVANQFKKNYIGGLILMKFSTSSKEVYRPNTER